MIQCIDGNVKIGRTKDTENLLPQKIMTADLYCIYLSLVDTFGLDDTLTILETATHLLKEDFDKGELANA